MQHLIAAACTALDQGEDLVLITITSHSGSTPRLSGARMLLFSDGRTLGSIGGGLVEATAIREGGLCLEEHRSGRHDFDLSNADAAVSDMICGGKMQVFLEYIAADEQSRALFHALREAVLSGRMLTLVCPLGDSDGVSDSGPRFLVDHRGHSSQSDIPDSLAAAIREARSSSSAALVLQHEGQSYLLSFFSTPGTVVLIGAGHVAARTAELAARTGFRVVVMDDRAEFANRERFPDADQVLVLDSFADCFHGHNIDNDTYLVIVTRGHMHDMEVLDQALRTQAGYIGMIGSRRKRDAIYTRLMDKGVSGEQLDRVHCPIGIAIKADTPEEIAVSIVAQLIHQRATGRAAWHLC
ncbi:MAG: XdhC family aldehyde oxidoreductase maturation factor [Desulfobulbus sp.]|jgi:xanthine dehydrogenase accessory factor